VLAARRRQPAGGAGLATGRRAGDSATAAPVTQRRGGAGMTYAGAPAPRRTCASNLNVSDGTVVEVIDHSFSCDSCLEKYERKESIEYLNTIKHGNTI